MIPTIIISVTTFILIILSLFLFPKMKIGHIKLSTYWIIALIGASILLISNLAPINEVWNQLTDDNSINPIKILALFFSMTLLSIFLDEFGLFQYLASLAVRNAKGNQYVLFFSFYALVSTLTVFTSNDIVILTLTPFICFFCKRAKINPLPYLISEFAAANTWSMLLIIGNPTNIFLTTSASINFFDYFKTMIIPTIGAGITELIIIYFLFRNKLKDTINVEVQEIDHIKNKPLLIIGVLHLLVCLIFLIISSYIGVEMWLISSITALSILFITTMFSIFDKKEWNYLFHPFLKLPYSLIPFFLSMFVIVVAFNVQGISAEIIKLFGNEHTVFIYGYSSFIASNLINNIPMSILYSNLCIATPNYISAVYASTIGSNIGAFLTPMGALAGIMFTNLVNEHKVKFSFIDFIENGVVIALPTITIALILLQLVRGGSW